MADFLAGFLSGLKQNIPYLKDHDIDSEVVIGIILHLILFIIFIYLLYLLVKPLM
jgi:hypothetical protein